MRPDPHDFVRASVAADMRGFEPSVTIVKERWLGQDGAFAVAYEDASGEPRRGIVGVCWDDDRLHGRGGFTGSAHVTRETDVWVTRGGYGTGYPPEAAAYGGWVTAAEAVAARAVDIQGQTLEDTVDDGVVLFMYTVPFNLRMARIELLDAAGQVILSGPM